MNKNQKKVLLGTAILLLLLLIGKPEVFWKRPTTSQERLQIIRTQAQIDREFFIYYPFVILVAGGLLFYLLRNKKDK